jgi:hypothetical protein
MIWVMDANQKSSIFLPLCSNLIFVDSVNSNFK